MNLDKLLMKSRLLLIGVLFGATTGTMGGLTSVSVDRFFWHYSIYEVIFDAKIALCFGIISGIYIMFRPFDIYKLLFFCSLLSLFLINFFFYMMKGPYYYLKAPLLLIEVWLLHLLPFTIASCFTAYFAILKLAFPFIDYYHLDELPKRSKSTKIIL